MEYVIENLKSYEFKQRVIEYANGKFDKQVHEFYSLFGNYFLGFKLDKLLFKSWNKFNKGEKFEKY